MEHSLEEAEKRLRMSGNAERFLNLMYLNIKVVYLLSRLCCTLFHLRSMLLEILILFVDGCIRLFQ